MLAVPRKRVCGMQTPARQHVVRPVPGGSSILRTESRGCGSRRVVAACCVVVPSPDGEEEGKSVEEEEKDELVEE